MRVLPLLAVVAAVLACMPILQVVHAGRTEPRFFDDCGSTTFEIRDQRRFAGGQVFSAKKLSTQDGVLSCNTLCRDNVECWSWNYQKKLKMCFLMSNTVSDMSSQRSGAWASGYRQCKATGDGWDNHPVNPGSSTPIPTPTPTPTATSSTTTRIRNESECRAYSILQVGGCKWNHGNGGCCHCPSCGCPFKDCKRDD